MKTQDDLADLIIKEQGKYLTTSVAINIYNMAVNDVRALVESELKITCGVYPKLVLKDILKQIKNIK